MKILFATFLLIFSFQFTFAQEKPKAEIIDEIGKVTCEDILSRVNGSIQHILFAETDTQLYFILRNEKRSVYHEKLITAAIYSTKVDKNRYKIIYSLPKDNIDIEFWKIPKDAEIPNFEINERLSKPLDLTKPFIFDYFTDDGVCPTFLPELYAELLKSNSHLNAHIVVRYDNKKYARETAKDWIKIFTEDFGIDRKRLKIFFAKSKKNYLSNVEFWLVPKKSRH